MVRLLRNSKALYKNNQELFKNFSYISVLQVFLMVIPLITYPYLVRILGADLYGVVITAQILASYCSIFVDFGFKKVSARHISINRNDKAKLSEIMSAILIARIALWLISFCIYLMLVKSVSTYNEHFLLFLFSFGLTFNELLFPQFFFQGIEKMGSITLINVVIRVIFVVLIFLFITQKEDYVLIPLFLSIGYFIGGLYSLFIIFGRYGVNFVNPGLNVIKKYLFDALPIFSTDVICTIKDKFNYIIIGQLIGMSEVVIYDLGAKIVNLVVTPSSILSTVLFPRIAEKKDINLFKKGTSIVIISNLCIVSVVYFLLPTIVAIFIDKNIDLLPIKLFLIAPVFLSLSSFISHNLILAFGYNRYILYSIFVTTIGYVIATVCIYVFELRTTMWVVFVAVVTYLIELIYRIILGRKILIYEKG